MTKANKEIASRMPKPKQPVDGKGFPIHTSNVPGYSRKAGTPGWIKSAAAGAAKKAK